MPSPTTSDPAAWAAHNARISALTPWEYAKELQEPGCDVLAYTVAVLTPSAELVMSVQAICDKLNRAARQEGRTECPIAREIGAAFRKYAERTESEEL